MSISLSQLRAFVAVADGGSFADAASYLATSQSAVSHAVAALEGELGANVLTRRPTVRLTALGSQVLSHARSAVAAADAVTVAASESRSGTSGLVRLAVAPTVAFSLLPTLMDDWRSAYPDIHFRVFEGDDDELLSWLDGGIVDAAILVNPTHSHPDAVEVGSDEYEATFRSDHPLAGEVEVDPKELLDDPLLCCAGACGHYVRDIMRTADPAFTPANIVSDIGTLLGMVSAGIGITVFPSIGRGMLPRGLVAVPLTTTVRRRLVFSGPDTRAWSPLVLALHGVLVAASEARAQAAASAPAH